MAGGAPESFGLRLRTLRETAGYTQEELATIAGLSVHAVSALERGERKRPHVETVRALSAALDLTGAMRDAFVASARASAHETATDELNRAALPVPPTPLLGRDADMTTLLSWLADPDARLVTLLGPGGVGKTRLALELARTIDEAGAVRVVFVPLATIHDSTLVAPAIADALGLADLKAVDLAANIRTSCAETPTLVVLDNCEHVLDAAPRLVADLLSSTPSLRVLATSRAPLHIRGEREYGVGPLSLAMERGGTSVADRARVPAVRLFLDRVRDVVPGFRLTVDNGPTVTEICRRLDALPLAIELAAPWMKVLSPADLLRRLEHDVLVSAVGRRDLPARQQTMNATVAWSYQLLDPEERRAFRRLGALPGRITVEASAAILASDGDSSAHDRALRLLATLIDRSLVHPTEGARPGRQVYQMLETVRAYALVQLDAHGEREEAMEGLARHCASEIAESADGLMGAAQGDWLGRLRDEFENYRAIIPWLVDRHRGDEASAIAWGLGFFCLIRGYTVEGLGWYTRILQDPPPSPLAHAQALTGAGLMYWAQGAADRARARLTHAFAVATAADAAEIAAHAETILGHVEHAAGNLDGARALYEQSVERLEAMGIRWALGNALSGLAGVTLTGGNPAEAERLLDRATQTLRTCGAWFLAPVLCFRAIVAVGRGDADEAIALMRESLINIRALHDRFAFVYALVPLAAAAVLKGDYSWAARLLGARDAVAQSTAATIVDSGVEHVRQHAETEARTHLGDARWTEAYVSGRTASIDSLLEDLENVRV